MSEPPTVARIYVLAGTNGAGKSTVAGAAITEAGGEYFNPDAAARQIRSKNPGSTETEANAAAWQEGKRLLERAIAERLVYTFETTLGGHTITRILKAAALEGHQVRVMYVGLASPELHIQRVRARVAQGGHNISEEKIRARFNHSRENLIDLLPYLSELRLFDNSQEGDPSSGAAPHPLLVLHVSDGQIKQACDMADVPDWAKPIVAAAMKL